MSKGKKTSPGTWVVYIIVILLLILSLGIIMRCNIDEVKQLSSPVLTTENIEVGKEETVSLSWTETKNADYYVLYIESNDEVQSMNCLSPEATISFSETGTYQLYVIARCSTGSYNDSEKSNVIQIVCSIPVEDICLSDSRLIY